MQEKATLGELIEQLVDQSGDLLKAEVRIAEAKVARRIQFARLPLKLFVAAGMLAFGAVFGAATAIVILVAPLVGFLLAVVIVSAAAAGGALWLFGEGQRRFEAVLEPPSLLRSGEADE